MQIKASEATFRNFSRVNLRRCTAKDGFNHPLESWSVAQWFTAVLGELGEAANCQKKLARLEEGIPGNKPTDTKDALLAKVAGELADTYIYLDLLAQRLGLDMGTIVAHTFNKKSAEINYTGPAATVPGVLPLQPLPKPATLGTQHQALQALRDWHINIGLPQVKHDEAAHYEMRYGLALLEQAMLHFEAAVYEVEA